MGMFDSVLVPKKNKVNIPVAKGEYQTYAGETLAIFTITEEGLLTYTPPTHGEWLGAPDCDANDLVIAVKAGTYCDCYFYIHGDGEDGVWHEFELVVLNNQILRVKDYDRLIYLNPDYPMLDETLNPVPDGHRLTVLKMLGVVFEEHRQSHFSFIPEAPHGKHRGEPHPIFNIPGIKQQLMSSKHHLQGSLTDLDLSYPNRIPDDLELMYPNRVRQLIPFTLEVRTGKDPATKILLIKRDTQTGVEEEFDPTDENVGKFNFTRDQLRLIENVKLVNNVRGDMSFREYYGVELFVHPSAKIHAKGSMDKLENDVSGGFFVQGEKQDFEFSQPFGKEAPVQVTEHPYQLDPKFVKEDGGIDIPALFEHLHGVPLAKVLGDLKDEKRLEGLPLNPDGSLDMMAVARKAQHFSRVGIHRRQLANPVKFEGVRLITSPVPGIPFGEEAYHEGLKGLYDNLINNSSARKAFLPKTVIVFHDVFTMHRAGKKNHRYSKCVEQISVGPRKKNYLSASARIDVKLSDEDMKELLSTHLPKEE